MSLGRWWLVVLVAGAVLASGCSMASQADQKMIHKARLNAEAAAATAASIQTPTAADWLAAQEWSAAQAVMWVALDDWAARKPPPITPARNGTHGKVTTDVAVRR